MPNVGLDRSQHAAAAAGAVHLRQAPVLDRVTDRGAGAVHLHRSDAGCVHSRRRQGFAVDGDLRGLRGHEQRLGATVLIGSRTAYHREDPVSVGQRIRQSLEHDHRATLGTHKAVRVNVECVAATGRREHALRGQRNTAVGLQQQRTAAGQREVALPLVQAAAGQMHREQTGRACGVHRHRRTVQAQRVGNAPGRHTVDKARRRVGARQVAREDAAHQVVLVGQPNEHPRRGARQRRRIETGVLDRLPRGLQQLPVLRVDRGRFPFADAKELGVETGDVVDEPTPSRYRSTRDARLGVVVVVNVPPVRRNLGDQVVTAQQGLPEFLGRVDASGQPASHPDNRNGRGRFLHNGRGRFLHKSIFLVSARPISHRSTGVTPTTPPNHSQGQRNGYSAGSEAANPGQAGSRHRWRVSQASLDDSGHAGGTACPNARPVTGPTD